MEIALFCARINILILLLALCSPCKFIQSPMDLGPLNFRQNANTASIDFGRIHFNSPSAVLRPKSPQAISLLLSFLSGSSFSKITVAARGAAHSIYGQAQALDGIVIEMDALPSNIQVHRKGEREADGVSYADASGGALWVELLEESLKHGLAPRSWTDYLYLSIGGTLSIGGISGQTFKYGPQISNVLQLDVVTGKGEAITCSPSKSSELFYSVLGGLGQFGIITRARILLQEAPEKVKWVRAFYDDFHTFAKDQDLLISTPDLVDYVEGFIVINEQSLKSFSTAFPAHLHFTPKFQSDGRSKVYYCIEYAVHDHSSKDISTEQVVLELSRQMRHLPSQVYIVEVSYYDFLNRVRMEEMSLRSVGLWEVPHPWLNMFVPKSGINEFVGLLLENISAEEFEGPVLIYPLLRDKWDANASVVLPDAADDQVIYIVGMLRSANPASCPAACLQSLLQTNNRIAGAASAVGAKQYIPHHSSPAGWSEHFGRQWARFSARKARFDPLGILAPGQGIFSRRSISISSL
ncbi:cytokinin dehydrogenase 3-like [Curcuma longa]|uniref:cytokinin dehydrogenase 3-like n=1 Tax=Curcuma longa TaxID=136217 RepID=UPI003D9DDCA1